MAVECKWVEWRCDAHGQPLLPFIMDATHASGAESVPGRVPEE